MGRLLFPGRICYDTANKWERSGEHGQKRFVEVYSQGINHGQKILMDTETGVNYLVVIPHLTEGCGLTVLVDQNGKPIVTPVDAPEE